MISDIIYYHLPANIAVNNIHFIFDKQIAEYNLIFINLATIHNYPEYRFIRTCYIGKLYFEIFAVNQLWLDGRSYPTEICSAQEMDAKLSKLQLLV